MYQQSGVDPLYIVSSSAGIEFRQGACVKILLIDDHALFREGVSHVLYKLEEHVSILEASDLEAATDHINGNPDIDLVLLDLHMPKTSGFDILETFAKSYPTLPVVILSASTKRSDVQRALDSGAMGFIPKDTTGNVMLNALQLILSGGIYTPPNLSQQASQVAGQANNQSAALTPRQLEVLKLMVQGHANKVIAAELELAEATVKMHVTAILNGLGVSNRTQAAMEAEKLGLCI